MMGRVAGLAVIFLCLSGNPWVGNVWAQGGLPPQVAADINAAAASERGDSGPLLSRVNASIVYYPAHVEEIIITAIEAAPQYGNRIVEQTIWAFPGFRGRILAGANAGQRATGVAVPVQRAAAPHTAYSAAPPPVQMAQSYPEQRAARGPGKAEGFYTDSRVSTRT